MRPAVSCLRTVLSSSRAATGSSGQYFVRELRPWLHAAQRSQRPAPSGARFLHEAAAVPSEPAPAIETQAPSNSTLDKLAKLPAYCPGCGAPSQIVAPDEAGHYTLTRQGLRKHLRDAPAQELEDGAESVVPASEASIICDRCHNLLHHAEGVPIFHPSIQSIHDIIDESPHKHNHIYHVLDAADLPMSLIPSLQHDLRLPRLRTQNRRSKHTTFASGRSAEVSFIITRADLLAPKKEQVDSLMPYLRELLRDALGRTKKNVRLGNLRCVSAKRGWWTTTVKEDIWKRGGGGWMVGKVNVGKSSLFEVVFPKGRGRQDTAAVPGVIAGQLLEKDALDVLGTSVAGPVIQQKDEIDDSDLSLLPPARQEVAYPAMPISSALPGTTASPIRVPYGSGRGELIDLPGVARSTLEDYVVPSARESLVMRSRIAASQLVIKPGQSLLLGGGLIRITPSTPDQIVLAYPFLPLDTHVTSTEKATEIQEGLRQSGISSIVAEGAHKAMRSAGNFALKWDVTRTRAGPLTSKSAAKLKPERLPFTVWAGDLVVEGIGWVELVAQTRRIKAAEVQPKSEALDNPFAEPEDEVEAAPEAQHWPKVEVFSPEGKHVMMRRPMNAWLLGGQRKPVATGKMRPRRSMTSVKQNIRGREMAAAASQ